MIIYLGLRNSFLLPATLALTTVSAGQTSPDVYLTNLNITSGAKSYTAPNTLTAGANVTISGSAAVIFSAGSNIVLQPGFQAIAGPSGTTLRAYVTTAALDPLVTSINPATVTLGPSQSQQFTATVPGISNLSVIWSISPLGVGTIASSGLYSAPPSVVDQQVVTLTATSLADQTKTATATVTLNPPRAVSLSPATVTLGPSQSQQFIATVTGISNPSVIWSVGPTGVGTISSSGLYTAPPSVVDQQVVTLTATSVTDQTKIATATVTFRSLSALTNLTVLGTTATQAILSYDAPTSAPCTVTVNEGDALNSGELVPDVDPAKFGPSANSDGRFPNIVSGTSRVVVIGERSVQPGVDGNNYSRALMANTQHFFQVTCGSGVASTTFTTQDPQFGSTYPERYGQWPTILATTSRVIDPLTGIPLWPLALNPNGWPAGARNIFCSENLVRSGDGYNGYACMFPSTHPTGDDLWFVDTADSLFRNTGQISTIWGNYSGDPLDTLPGAQNTIYSTALNNGAGGLLTVAVNKSTNVPVLMSGVYTGGWMANDFAASWTNLTPSTITGGLPGLIDAYDSRFDITIQNNNATPLGLTGDGLHFAVWFNQGTQNGIGWVGVFDMHGKVSAALPFHLSSRTRWCGEHSATVVENSNGLLSFEPAGNRFTGTGWEMDSGGSNDGDGPWLSNVTSGTLTSTPAYSVGSPIEGFPGLTCTHSGLTIMGCDVVSVGGQPCDPTPGSLEPNNCPQPGFNGYYLMSAQVGDRVMAVDTLGPTNIRESMIIIGISGNQWVLARGAPDQMCSDCNNLVQDHTALSALGMVCAPNFESDNIAWDWLSDPHGTGSAIATDNGIGIGGTLSNQISEHTTAGNNAMGGALDWWQCGAVDSRLNADCIGIKTGVAASYMGTVPVSVGPGTPPFAEVWPYPGNAYIEHYTSGSPSNPTVANPNFVIDARPYETVSQMWVPLGNGIYQVIGNTGLNVQYAKTTPLDTSCGGQQMIDVSSPAQAGSGPVAGLTAANTYCLANTSGECYSGSVPGNIYANCGIAVGDQTQTWVTAAGANYGKLTEYRWDDPTYLGRNIRVLTSCGRLKSRQTSYWSARVLPHGDYGVCYSDQLPGSDQSAIMLMGLPPVPAWDGVDRTTWVPVSVPIAGGHGAALVTFGYAENGGMVATTFNCTTRLDSCEVAASTIQDPPFDYASEGLVPIACDSGCTIQVPAISGRVLYYQIVHGDGYPEPLRVVAVQ